MVLLCQRSRSILTFCIVHALRLLQNWMYNMDDADLRRWASNINTTIARDAFPAFPSLDLGLSYHSCKPVALLARSARVSPRHVDALQHAVYLSTPEGSHRSPPPGQQSQQQIVRRRSDSRSVRGMLSRFVRC